LITYQNFKATFPLNKLIASDALRNVPTFVDEKQSYDLRLVASWIEPQFPCFEDHQNIFVVE